MAVNYVAVFCLFSVLLISGANSRVDEQEFEPSDICRQRADPGMCMGYFPRWHFNTTLNKCISFVYGGCQGNQNRFGSKKKCEKTCLPTKFQSSFDEQEKQQESSSTHQDDEEQHSTAEEQETQQRPCIAALENVTKNMTPAQKFWASVLVKGVPMFGPKYMPTCDEEGYYAPMQCFRHKNECWCVDRLGNEIKNSREKRTRGKRNKLECS